MNLNGRIMDFSETRVMGILNLTPDSFYDGGEYTHEEEIRNRIRQLVAEGADIIDVGGYSSRPGAAKTDTKEEMTRLYRGLSLLRSEFPEIPVSVDTFRAEVASAMVREFDVALINDISAGDMDPKMFETIAGLGVGYIMMHMQGTPQTMQLDPKYTHVVRDILAILSRKLAHLRQLGVRDIIADPGFGFGKSVEHNYQILHGLSAFRALDVPVMVGVSRKSMICKILQLPPDEALNGTTVIHTLALLNGADILRVHDVKEAKEVIRLLKAYRTYDLSNAG